MHGRFCRAAKKKVAIGRGSAVLVNLVVLCQMVCPFYTNTFERFVLNSSGALEEAEKPTVLIALLNEKVGGL